MEKILQKCIIFEKVLNLQTFNLNLMLEKTFVGKSINMNNFESESKKPL